MNPITGAKGCVATCLVLAAADIRAYELPETLFEYAKLPLTIWFLGMYFLTQPKNGTSVVSSLARIIPDDRKPR